MLGQELNVRMPDKFGLSQKQLNCLQFACKEILKISGRHDLIEIFIHPLDCQTDGMGIRNEPPEKWNRGVRLSKVSSDSLSLEQIQRILEKHQHCLIKYHGILTPFSSFYNQFPAQHWLMIYDIGDRFLYTFDDYGHPDYYRGVKGQIPKDLCQRLLEQKVIYSLAFVQEEIPSMDWENEFFEVMRSSVLNMKGQGLKNLNRFCEVIGSMNVEDMIKKLNDLDYYVYFFRKPRELLALAWQRERVPQKFYHIELEEILNKVCKHWNIISGYILKWNYVKKRDYRPQLISNLNKAIDLERVFIERIESILRECEKGVG